MATHIDKNHFHNHVIFNSTDIESKRKFNNFFYSSMTLRKLNDLICIETGLSVIKTPKLSKGNYGTWLGDKKSRMCGKTSASISYHG